MAGLRGTLSATEAKSLLVDGAVYQWVLQSLCRHVSAQVINLDWLMSNILFTHVMDLFCVRADGDLFLILQVYSQPLPIRVLFDN